jgi:hypothetical protein
MWVIEFGVASDTQPLFPILTTAKTHGTDDVARAAGQARLTSNVGFGRSVKVKGKIGSFSLRIDWLSQPNGALLW